MTLIDTHCHLYMPPLNTDTGAVQTRARKRHVTDVIIPAYDQASWDLMTPYESIPNFHTAYGIHPWLAHEIPAGGYWFWLPPVRRWIPKAFPLCCPGDRGFSTERKPG